MIPASVMARIREQARRDRAVAFALREYLDRVEAGTATDGCAARLLDEAEARR